MQTDQAGSQMPGAITGQHPVSSSKKSDGAHAAKDKEEAEPTVLDELREKGFQAYVEEIQERKKEELREKILIAMGLSEEQLAEMPPEQRDQIENIISEEIRRRMMAQATMNSGDTLPKPGETLKPPVTGDIQNGMGSGLTLINAMTEADDPASAVRQKNEKDDG